ncbi:MAG: SelB C-terminal domain-containing protein, partial [Bacillus sp. (in: firmicutes)]
PRALLDFVIEQGVSNGTFGRKDQFVSQKEFVPHVPTNWAKRTENMLQVMKKDGMKVRYLLDYFKEAGIPESLTGDLKRFLEDQGQIAPLDDQYYWDGDIFANAVELLRSKTGPEFEVGDAKDVLDLSRKYMIPFLERLDAKGYTKRIDNKRVWQKQ